MTERGNRVQYVVIGASWCKWCARAKELLDARGLEYTYMDVDWPDNSAINRLLATIDRPTLPQVYHNGDRVGGYTDLVAYLS